MTSLDGLFPTDENLVRLQTQILSTPPVVTDEDLDALNFKLPRTKSGDFDVSGLGATDRRHVELLGPENFERVTQLKEMRRLGFREDEFSESDRKLLGAYYGDSWTQIQKEARLLAQVSNPEPMQIPTGGGNITVPEWVAEGFGRLWQMVSPAALAVADQVAIPALYGIAGILGGPEARIQLNRNLAAGDLSGELGGEAPSAQVFLPALMRKALTDSDRPFSEFYRDAAIRQEGAREEGLVSGVETVSGVVGGIKALFGKSTAMGQMFGKLGERGSNLTARWVAGSENTFRKVAAFVGGHAATSGSAYGAFRALADSYDPETGELRDGWELAAHGATEAVLFPVFVGLSQKAAEAAAKALTPTQKQIAEAVEKFAKERGQKMLDPAGNEVVRSLDEWRNLWTGRWIQEGMPGWRPTAGQTWSSLLKQAGLEGVGFSAMDLEFLGDVVGGVVEGDGEKLGRALETLMTNGVAMGLVHAGSIREFYKQNRETFPRIVEPVAPGAEKGKVEGPEGMPANRPPADIEAMGLRLRDAEGMRYAIEGRPDLTVDLSGGKFEVSDNLRAKLPEGVDEATGLRHYMLRDALRGRRELAGVGYDVTVDGIRAIGTKAGDRVIVHRDGRIYERDPTGKVWELAEVEKPELPRVSQEQKILADEFARQVIDIPMDPVMRDTVVEIARTLNEVPREIDQAVRDTLELVRQQAILTAPTPEAQGQILMEMAATAAGFKAPTKTMADIQAIVQENMAAAQAAYESTPGSLQRTRPKENKRRVAKKGAAVDPVTGKKIEKGSDKVADGPAPEPEVRVEPEAKPEKPKSALEAYTELKRRARELGVESPHKMKLGDLREAVKKAEGERSGKSLGIADDFAKRIGVKIGSALHKLIKGEKSPMGVYNTLRKRAKELGIDRTGEMDEAALVKAIQNAEAASVPQPVKIDRAIRDQVAEIVKEYGDLEAETGKQKSEFRKLAKRVKESELDLTMDEARRLSEWVNDWASADPIDNVKLLEGVKKFGETLDSLTFGDANIGRSRLEFQAEVAREIEVIRATQRSPQAMGIVPDVQVPEVIQRVVGSVLTRSRSKVRELYYEALAPLSERLPELTSNKEVAREITDRVKKHAYRAGELYGRFELQARRIQEELSRWSPESREAHRWFKEAYQTGKIGDVEYQIDRSLAFGDSIAPQAEMMASAPRVARKVMEMLHDLNMDQMRATEEARVFMSKGDKYFPVKADPNHQRWQRIWTQDGQELLRSKSGREALAKVISDIEMNGVSYAEARPVLDAVARMMDVRDANFRASEVQDAREQAREFRVVPNRIKLNGEWIDILEADPFKFVSASSHYLASRIAFIEQFGQDLPKSVRAKYSEKELPKPRDTELFEKFAEDAERGDLAREAVTELTRAMNGLSIKGPLFESQTWAGRFNRRVLRPATGLWAVLKLTGAPTVVVNALEPLNVLSTYVGHGNALKAMREVYSSFIRGGGEWADIRNRAANSGIVFKEPTRLPEFAPRRGDVWDSLIELGNIAALPQKIVNGLNEIVAFRTGELLRDNWKGTNTQKAAVRELRLPSEIESRILDGKGKPDDWAFLIRHLPQFTQGTGNLTEISRWQQRPTTSTFFRFLTFARNYARYNADMLSMFRGTAIEAGRRAIGKKPTKSTEELLGEGGVFARYLAGKGVVGIPAFFLISSVRHMANAMMLVDADDAETIASNFVGELAEYMFLQEMAGPIIGSIAKRFTGDHVGNLYTEIAKMTAIGSLSHEILSSGLIPGIEPADSYTNEHASERAWKFVQRQVPLLGQLSRFYSAGADEETMQFRIARSRYYDFMRENDKFTMGERSGFKEFTAIMRDFRDAFWKAGHDGNTVGREELFNILRDAADVGENSWDSVASSLRSRKLLSELSRDEQNELRWRIGTEQYNVLAEHDRAIDGWLNMVKRLR